jgi:hypothetical protein
MTNNADSPIGRRALLRMGLVAATCVVAGCSEPGGSEEGGTDKGASRRVDSLKAKYQQIRAKGAKK